MYLIEVISKLIRCVSLDIPQQAPIEQGQPQSPYHFADVNFSFKLTENNLLLWTPDVSFIIQLFSAAHKPRASVALAKAYMHYGYYEPEFVRNIFNVV